MVYNAIKHIEPAILAELAELAAAGTTEKGSGSLYHVSGGIRSIIKPFSV